MATQKRLHTSWESISEALFAQMAPLANDSPAVRSTLERGARYMVVDTAAREVVFNTRALTLGLLSAGRDDESSLRWGNTASWFAAWLAESVGDDAVDQALKRVSEAGEIVPALDHGHTLVLSVSVLSLLEPASLIATRTVGRPRFDMRHLFAALIENGALAVQLKQEFDLRLTDDLATQLKQMLVERIMADPEKGETRTAWEGTLRLSGDHDALPKPSREEMAGFTADAVRRGDDNLLGSAGDVTALARLMCLEKAAPLAIAVFGGWGSGKSTFMDRLDSAVERIAARSAPADGPTTDGGARFVNRVVQIRFNAWQFVDANLWASLTAEFFDQLRAGGWQRADKARHGALVDKVNLHVHALAADADESRKAAIAGDKTLLAAQKERDVAARAAREASTAALGQALIDRLGDAYEQQKGNLTALGLATTGTDTGEAVETLLDVVSQTKSGLGSAKAVLKTLSKSPKRIWTAGLAALAAVALTGFVGWRLIAGFAPGDLIALFAALSAVATAAGAALPALRLVGSVAKWGAGIAAEVDKADTAATRTLLEKELALRAAREEALALQDAATRSDRSLARYIDPGGAPNPPRLLRYVLEDDPDTKALQAEIGLIGRTRRLFQAVDDIVRRELRKSPAERIDPEIPQRIVLYIDDLDRCTEEQVYSVLQAIHLLLAFDLFVVVVGVDVAWIEKALGKSLGVTDPDDRRKEAVRYLEKIFQVAFWLSPLDSGGDDGGSYGRYVRALTEPMRAATSPAAARAVRENDPSSEATDASRTEITTDSTRITSDSDLAGDDQAADEPSAEVAMATIQLDPREIEFLASPAIAAVAASTPRSVKRLVNMYRLVRVRISEDGGSPLGDDGRPPDYPLIALAVAIETGQPVEVADAIFEGLAGWPAIGPLKDFPRRQTNLEPPDPLVSAVMGKPAFQLAFEEVARLRDDNFLVGDLSRAMRIARRYSFNGHRGKVSRPSPV
jgi:hypothetical protein